MRIFMLGAQHEVASRQHPRTGRRRQQLSAITANCHTAELADRLIAR